MTKEQVIQKFEDFAEAIQTYNRQKESGKPSNLSVIAVFSELGEDSKTADAKALLVGPSGLISESLSGALKQNENLKDIIMEAIAYDFMEGLIDANSKEDELESAKS